MTLFESMKTMTVEELARKIAAIATDCDECGGCFDCDGNCLTCIDGKYLTTNNKCSQCILPSFYN